MSEATTGLAASLAGLGIRAGDPVLLEAPAAEMPEETARTLLAAWLDLLGPAGTLAVPTCTAVEGYPKPTFDPALSPSEAGAFSEFFRGQPGAVRSHSPTHSVAALGPAASEIVSGHRTAAGRPTPWGDGPFGHGSPWDVLAGRDAWWVMFDAPWDGSPFMAYVAALIAERGAGVTKAAPFPRFSGERLAEALYAAGLVLHAGWEGHRLAAFRMRPALDAALALWERDPGRLAPDEETGRWLASLARVRAEGYLQAAAVRLPITPSLPCRRWDGKPLTGVYRDLYARILVLEHGAGRVALVACDLLGIAHHLTEEIRRRVGAAAGFPGDGVMIACTHAHSTPDTVGSGNEDPAYLESLVSGIAGGICSALERMQPARLGWGRVPVRGLAQSRRVKLADGRVFTTRYGVPSTWRVRPELIAGQGSIDPDLTVLRVESLAGEVLAAVTNFGCHPSVALMSPNISGDYMGEAAHALEAALGASAVVLCTNGSAGDVDPTLEMPFWGPRVDANALRLGRIFAGQVLECLERVAVADDASISAARVPVDLPVRGDWIHLVTAEQARLAQEFAAAQARNPVIDAILREGVIHTEVQALRLNDLTLAAFPGEVLTATGLKAKALAPGRKAAVVEVANDYAGYILTPEAAAEGGYETGLHLWTRVTADAEALLLGAARDALRQIARPT